MARSSNYRPRAYQSHMDGRTVIYFATSAKNARQMHLTRGGDFSQCITWLRTLPEGLPMQPLGTAIKYKKQLPTFDDL